MKTNWLICTVEYTQTKNKKTKNNNNNKKKKHYHEQQHGCTERLSLRYETKGKHPKIVLKSGSQKFMQMK